MNEYQGKLSLRTSYQITLRIFTNCIIIECISKFAENVANGDG